MAVFLPEPAPLPVTLDEVKAFLRIGHADEDALIGRLARAAAETCEAFTDRALVARAVEETLPATRTWARLTAAPVRAVEGVSALDSDGVAQALAAEDYAIDIDAAGNGWVRLLAAIESKRVRVAYEAGLAADADGIPEALRHGIVRLATHLYTHRDPEAGKGPPAAITALWRPWRRLRLH